jgi:[protein-PII] uridylyltransferase
LKHFKVKTRVEFLPTKTNKHSLVEFQALDTPGLLTKVSSAFADLDIHLHAAKITTIGERAEDLFILSSTSGCKLNQQEEEELRDHLTDVVEELSPS